MKKGKQGGSSNNNSNNNNNNSSNKKGKKSYGTGKVTPVQIAFLVDRYLSDEGYSHSRSLFRSEASSFFSVSPPHLVPKGLLSLGEILDEYINMKEQKVTLDQEKARLDVEKFRVQTLLQGMQDVMNTYNGAGDGQTLSQQTLPPSLVSSAITPPTSLVSSIAAKSAAVAPQMGSSAAGYLVYSPPVWMPASKPSTTHIGQSSLSTPVTKISASKRRKNTQNRPVNAKRSRIYANKIHLPLKGTDSLTQTENAANNQENPPQSSPNSTSLIEVAPVQGSTVAKCLFNKNTPSPPTNTSVPKAPNRASPSHTDKSPYSLQTSSTATYNDNVTPHKTTSTNHVVISAETIRFSPVKQISYVSVERNHCISSSSPIKSRFTRLNKRDHVKGRLDFDVSESTLNTGNWVSNESVPFSDKEREIFDLDLPNLDVLGVDFSLSDLLGDFDPDGDFCGQPEVDSSPGSHSGSPNETRNTELGADQVFTNISSTVTEIFSEKDMDVQGQQAVTSVRSRTKSINIISPVKNIGSSHSCQESTQVVN